MSDSGRSIIGYLRENSEVVKHFVRYNKLGRSLVVAAAVAIPAMGFADNMQTAHNIEQAAHQMGIVRDISDMGGSNVTPNFDLSSGSSLDSASTHIFNNLDMGVLSQYAVSDVQTIDTGKNLDGFEFASAKINDSVDFGKLMYYDSNKHFTCDRADIQEFVGNGNYVYFPVRSSGKNDDVKAYVDTPGHLKHNDYSMGRNESRDNAEYGFKRQRDMQRTAMMAGKEYVPSILNRDEFNQFKSVFGTLNQQNARFVPLFSSHPKFAQYKVDCVADLDLNKVQRDFLDAKSGRLTKSAKLELAQGQQMQSPQMDGPQQASQVAFKADTSKFISDGNGFGIAKVQVTFDAEDRASANRMGKICALKQLNQEGRIVDGTVTSLSNGPIQDLGNGKYSMEVNVGGVLPANAVIEASTVAIPGSIHVGFESWDDSGRKVLNAEEFRAESSAIMENPMIAQKIEEKIQAAESLNAELQGVDFSVDNSHQAVMSSNTLDNNMSMEPQAAVKSEPVHNIEVPTFDSAPVLQSSNELAKASKECLDAVKAERIEAQKLHDFNEKYNSGNYLKDNFNRLKDGLTGEKFNIVANGLSDKVNAAATLSAVTRLNFNNILDQLKQNANGIDCSKLVEQADAFKFAVFNENYNQMKAVSGKLEVSLNDFNKAVSEKDQTFERVGELVKASEYAILPGMEASEAYKILAGKSYIENDGKLFDTHIAKNMLERGFSDRDISEALESHSPNFVNKEAKSFVRTVSKELSQTKENTRSHVSEKAVTRESRNDDYSR